MLFHSGNTADGIAIFILLMLVGVGGVIALISEWLDTRKVLHEWPYNRK